MTPCLRVRVSVVVGLAVAGGACDEPGAQFREFDTAAQATAWRSDDPEAPPGGFSFKVNGTHARECTGMTKCPTMWAETPSPNNCGGDGTSTVSFIVHQRGTDWDGIEGENELQGHDYTLEDFGPVAYDQSVIVQCCPSPPATTAFFAAKACPDPCGAPDALCPTTCGPQRFGGCVTCFRINTPRCDLALVEAGWRDPHAPHDLQAPSGDDKDVWEIWYRIAWTCGDGICDTDETSESCAEDCGAP